MKWQSDQHLKPLELIAHKCFNSSCVSTTKFLVLAGATLLGPQSLYCAGLYWKLLSATMIIEESQITGQRNYVFVKIEIDYDYTTNGFVAVESNSNRAGAPFWSKKSRIIWQLEWKGYKPYSSLVGKAEEM